MVANKELGISKNRKNIKILVVQKFGKRGQPKLDPVASMYGISTYIWVKFMVYVGKYSIPMDPMGV